MRRKIELYIGGRRADLNDQALVLFNYSLTDIQKPTAVKNAYSKQITLPGTPANDAIFSGSYRVDRTVGLGQFNPLERTAFVIYDEKGTILEQGYAKLDKVTSKGENRTYAVTLYGGLGSFFYGLSYKSNGEKMTLADLQYIAGEDFDDELDFVRTGRTWTRGPSARSPSSPPTRAHRTETSARTRPWPLPRRWAFPSRSRMAM